MWRPPPWGGARSRFFPRRASGCFSAEALRRLGLRSASVALPRGRAPAAGGVLFCVCGAIFDLLLLKSDGRRTPAEFVNSEEERRRPGEARAGIGRLPKPPRWLESFCALDVDSRSLGQVFARAGIFSAVSPHDERCRGLVFKTHLARKSKKKRPFPRSRHSHGPKRTHHQCASRHETHTQKAPRSLSPLNSRARALGETRGENEWRGGGGVRLSALHSRRRELCRAERHSARAASVRGPISPDRR